MARTSQEITQQEKEAYWKFCAEHGVINDGSQADIDNATFVRDYFLKTWDMDITEETLRQAGPQIRGHLKLIDPDQLEFNKLFVTLAAEERNVLGEWRGQSGLKNTARNCVVILSWLKSHGFKVTNENLQLAVGQQRLFSNLEWEPVQSQPLKGRVVHEADPNHKPGQFITDANKSQLDYARERAAAAATNNPSAPDSIAKAERQARHEAENLQGRTHSKTAQLRKLFITKSGSSEIDWPSTLAARKNLQQSFEREEAVSFRRY
jgi:hypothetical protein